MTSYELIGRDSVERSISIFISCEMKMGFNV